jgi:hypothetical protein
MRLCKPSLLLWAVGCISIHAFGQNAIDGQTVALDDSTLRQTFVVDDQTTHERVSAGSDETLATYVTGAITKPSSGQFNYIAATFRQSNGTGWGRGAEYRRRIHGRNYGGILFSDTPTNGTLDVRSQHWFISWPAHRYEFDILWTHEFSPVRHRLVPYVNAGAGAIAFNGGSGASGSGWDRQGALVGGGGGDVHLSRLITLRAGVTLDSFKASTYSDPTYRSNETVMVEPRIGLVWGFGLPHPQVAW